MLSYWTFISDSIPHVYFFCLPNSQLSEIDIFMEAYCMAYAGNVFDIAYAEFGITRMEILSINSDQSNWQNAPCAERVARGCYFWHSTRIVAVSLLECAEFFECVQREEEKKQKFDMNAIHQPHRNILCGLTAVRDALMRVCGIKLKHFWVGKW